MGDCKFDQFSLRQMIREVIREELIWLKIDIRNEENNRRIDELTAKLIAEAEERTAVRQA